jgi:uncharacterized membrane protein
MIYKIFLPAATSSCFFSTSNLFFSEVKTENKQKKKLPKQKNTSESNAEVVYNNLNSNQFAAKLESFTKALKGFI